MSRILTAYFILKFCKICVSKRKSKDLPKFSLQERMHLSLDDSVKLFNRTEAMIVGGLISAALAIAVSYLFFTTMNLYGSIVPVEDCKTDVYAVSDFIFHPEEGCYDFISNFDSITPEKFVGILYSYQQDVVTLIVIVMLLLGGMGIWWLIKGRKIKKEMKEIKNQYIKQAYYFVLQTSTHEVDAIEDFFNIAIDIFPELKEQEIKSLKKKEEELSIEETILKDAENYKLDAAQNTREGDFIIKNFEQDEVNFSDINTLVKAISKSYKDKDVFRIVCLGKSFSDSISKKFNELEIKKIVLDLIRITDKGFDVHRLG